jgi:outer membrane protein OmpA-like peptidoglycan-associated protein
MRRVPVLFALSVSLGLSSALLSGCASDGGSGSETGRKYVLFFTKDSTAISPAGAGVLKEAAAVAVRHPDMTLLVAGFAAAHGDLDADAALSERRAQLVAATLQADGVAASRIAEHARPPANEDPAVSARRVEVSFVSGS